MLILSDMESHPSPIEPVVSFLQPKSNSETPWWKDSLRMFDSFNFSGFVIKATKGLLHASKTFMSDNKLSM